MGPSDLQRARSPFAQKAAQPHGMCSEGRMDEQPESWDCGAGNQWVNGHSRDIFFFSENREKTCM